MMLLQTHLNIERTVYCILLKGFIFIPAQGGLSTDLGILVIWCSASGFFLHLHQVAIFVNWHKPVCTELGEAVQERVCW